MKYYFTILFILFDLIGMSQVIPKLDSARGYQYIDTISSVVISKHYYDQAAPFRDGMARVNRGGLWGFIDQTGKEVIPCRYARAVDFSEGIGAVSIGKINISEASVSTYIEDEKFALIDKKGNYRSGFLFTWVNQFENGLSRVLDLISGNWGWVDSSGNWKITPKYERVISDFDEAGLAIVSGEGWGNNIGCINYQGEYVVSPEYYSISSIKNGLRLVKKYNELTYDFLSGFLDQSGKVIIPLVFDEAEEFSNGVALVGKMNEKKEMKFFYLDNKGAEIFQIKYDLAYSFSNNVAMVRQDSRYKLIDINGKDLRMRSYDIAENFAVPNDREDNTWPYALVSNNGFWGAIDKNGNEVIPTIYDSIAKEINGFICKKEEKLLTVDFDNKITSINIQVNSNSIYESSISNYYSHVDLSTDYVSANNMDRKQYYYVSNSVDSIMLGILYAKKSSLKNKYAIFSKTGKRLSEYEYDNFFRIPNQTSYAGVKGDALHIINYNYNDNNVTFNPTTFLSIYNISDYDVDATPRINSGKYRVMKNTGWGVVTDLSDDHSFVVPPVYEDIGFLPDKISNFVPVKKGGKWGFFDIRSSSLIIPCQFDQIGYYSKPNIWQVFIQGKWRFITEDGRMISNLYFDDATNYATREDMCGIKIGNKWGFIDESMHWVVKPLFQKIGLSNIDYAYNFALLNKMVLVIEKYGRWNLSQSVWVNSTTFY